MKQVALSVILLLLLAPAMSAKGGSFSGGARSSKSFSSGSRSSSSRSRASRSSSSKPSSRTSSAKVKTARGTGYKVGQGGYSPNFRPGYRAPAGSIVYYQQSSWLDYLPLYFLATHDSHQQVTVQQPDGKQVKTEEQGVDGMYIWNWIFMILLSFGFIAGAMYLVNKLTQPKGVSHDAYATS